VTLLACLGIAMSLSRFFAPRVERHELYPDEKQLETSGLHVGVGSARSYSNLRGLGRALGLALLAGMSLLALSYFGVFGMALRPCSPADTSATQIEWCFKGYNTTDCSDHGFDPKCSANDAKCTPLDQVLVALDFDGEHKFTLCLFQTGQCLNSSFIGSYPNAIFTCAKGLNAIAYTVIESATEDCLGNKFFPGHPPRALRD